MKELCLLLFGDGVLVSHAQLQAQAIRSRGDPFLTLLLRRSGDALRKAIAQIPPLDIAQI